MSDDDDDESTTMLSHTSEWMGIFPSQMPSNRSSPRNQCKSLRHHISDSKDESPSPSVKVLKTKDYTNISRLVERDHLTDDNWHEWKDRML
jgi:hypothetical protein